MSKPPRLYNAGRGDFIVSFNLVLKAAMISGRSDYDFSPLQLDSKK